MKIEKLSDNQIRCTLTRADLAERQLQLSELAYGTEKARSLFHDMMQQAAQEFGFEAENMPLMIEAIPSSSDSIVLIITKVEDPEELDTRFSKFAPLPGQDGDSSRQGLPDKLEGAESLLDLLGKVKEKINAAQSSSKPENPVSSSSESLDDPETEALENEIPKDAAPKKPAIRKNLPYHQRPYASIAERTLVDISIYSPRPQIAGTGHSHSKISIHSPRAGRDVTSFFARSAG